MTQLTEAEELKNKIALTLMQTMQVAIIDHCIKNVAPIDLMEARFSLGDIAYSLGAATASAIFELDRQENQIECLLPRR